MTTREKNKKKRLAKLFSILCTTMTIYWVLQLIAMFAFIHLINLRWRENHMMLLMSIIILPLLISLISSSYSNGYIRDLNDYVNNIKEYRARRHFNKCLDLLQEGNLNEAIDIFNCIPSKHEIRNNLVLLIAFNMTLSDNQTNKIIGADRLNKIREVYNPDDVKL
jgi:hypothetical protein